MKLGSQVDLESVLVSVGESELFSRRYAIGLGARIPPQVNLRVRYSPSAEWSADDRRAIVSAAQEVRSDLLGPLVGAEVRWFEATLEAKDLAPLRTVGTAEFEGLAPDRRLGTLVAEIERGRDTPDAEFSGAVRRLRREFQLPRMRGRPGLIRRTIDGPFTVFEGMTRLAALLALVRAGGVTACEVPSYVGLTDSLPRWAADAPPADAAPSDASKERPGPV